MAHGHGYKLFLSSLWGRQLLTMPLATAMSLWFSLHWEHVIVHPNCHGDEHHTVIEKMEFHARENQLQNAGWHWRMEKVVMDGCLSNQQSMLNVMPKLNVQRDSPPLVRGSSESFAQHPNSDQHDQSIAVMQSFG